MIKKLIGVAIVATFSTQASAVRENDFGRLVENQLNAQTYKYFGITKPLRASASTNTERQPGQDAADLVDLARGLNAKIITRDAGNKTDMLVLWPEENPSYIITCVEGGREIISANGESEELAKYNPSVQRINIETGVVETILRGMSRCDGIRSTAWGTILATEEASDGAAYEILDPLNITNETVIDRDSGANTAPGYVVKRTALPIMSWEGLTILENGVVIGGDELRPGSDSLDDDGGAIFKFVPKTLYHTTAKIDNLSDSPLADGTVYAMTISCRETTHRNFPQYGQGCEIGAGAWVKVNAETARADANQRGATGYYRPEDLHRDPVYTGPGIRFCWTNTGREAAENYAEVMCAVDLNPDAIAELVDSRNSNTYLAESGKYAVVKANRFVEGDADFNSVDNLAFQPLTGIVYVIEDHRNGDIFACLRDGADRDIKTDGCVKVLSVKDQSAEPTGFLFSADGLKAYLSIQHSADDNMPEFDDYRTDDLIEITGFRINRGMLPRN